MRSLKSSLLAIGLAGLFGTAAVVGCSASGGGDDTTDQSPTDPNQNNSASLPPPSNPPTGDNPPPPSGTDAGKKDSGTDSGKDAGPPPPNPGDSCTKVDSTASKQCGACGTQQAICQGDPEAGTLKWSDYGVCQGELAGGCTPGTTEACGNCGTHTCSKYCAWDTCKEPPGACTPNAKDYSAAGCTTPSTYRMRTCGTTCSWSSFSTTCAAPVNDIVLNSPTTVGQTTSTNITLAASKVGNRVTAFGTCPLSAGDVDTGNYPYQYVEVKNTSAKAQTVTVYTSAAPGGPNIDTVIVGYSTALQPMDETGMEACAFGPDDQCSATADTALCGDSNFSILHNVTIPAGASILINVSTYYENGSGTQTTTGTIKLNVKLDSAT